MSSGMGEPGDSKPRACACKSAAPRVIDPLQLVLAALNKELERLHLALEQEYGDVDVTQEQIGEIQQQLLELASRIYTE